MNKLRRKTINTIISSLGFLQGIESDVTSTLEDIYSDIEFIYDEEYEYMNNIPENMQGGRKYEAAEEACDYLDDAKDCIRSAISSDDIDVRDEYISEAIEYLENAAM